MIDMHMRRQRNHGLAIRQVQELAKRAQPHAEIDDEIGVPPDHVKEVGPEEQMHVRFPDAADPAGISLRLEPVMLHAHVSRSIQ